MKRRKNRIKAAHRLILPAVFAIVSVWARAADTKGVTAEAGFSKPEATIGEKVRFSITVVYPKGTKVNDPAIEPVLGKAGFAVRDFGRDKPVKVSGGRERSVYWYLLDTYVTGAYNVPAVSISYTLPDGIKGNVLTKDVFLEVKSVIKKSEKAEDIKDIKRPVEIKVDRRRLILWGGICTVFLVVFLSVFLYMRRRRAAKDAPVSVPAHITAMEALNRIRGETRVKEYYMGVSGIIRHYIENRFNLHAPERTTEEFLRELRYSDSLNRRHKDLLHDFLTHCDMVKFARYGPTEEEIKGVYDTAVHFVEETKEARG